MPANQLKRLLNTLADGKTLSASDMEAALDLLMSGVASPVQLGAFLMALRVRGETVPEITGAASFLRSRMTPAEAPPSAIDIAGTGGDSHGTYNVSTAAAIVAAGAGVPVAKHGNRSVSSLSGASDVLQALGVKIDIPALAVTRAIHTANAGFLWAPMHHPAMKLWAPVRADLGIRSLFNLLGPLCNPAGVKRQVLGVYDRKWLEPMAEALKNLGSVHAWVVHGSDGMDELTTTGPSAVAELVDGNIHVFEVTPEDAGLPRATLADLKGGSPEVNAAKLRALLLGETGPYRDIVLFNTAAALIVAGKAPSLEEGVRLAASAIDSGAANLALDKLIAVTNEAV